MDDRKRWKLVRSRTSAGSSFVYCVKTTGIYCRPGCAARLPLRHNVEFRASWSEAEASGYRACRRCRPEASLAPHASLVARACRLMDESETPLRLAELAAAVGVSPFHFHRVFKRATGITPKAYSDARRAERVRTELARPGTVTRAAHAAGFSSSSRFYASSAELLGMMPVDYKRGGERHSLRFALGESGLGWVLVAATERGICAVELGSSRHRLIADLKRCFPAAQRLEADVSLERSLDRVIAFIERPRRDVLLPLDVRGTAFQRRVWSALRRIPPGATATYKQIAASIGAPQSSRAVAGACARNPVAVLIPCHRAVRADGSPSGYRWGIRRKQALLERESDD